jgi:hypothetical protein
LKKQKVTTTITTIFMMAAISATILTAAIIHQPALAQITGIAPTPPPTNEPNVIIDRPTAARLAAEDPYFATFEQVLDSCMDLIFGNATITPAQCQTTMQQGADRWCGLEFYDQLKCNYASEMTRQFNRINNLLGGFGLDQVPNLFSPTSLIITPEETPPATPGSPATQYIDEENGFRFQLPAGWIAEEPAEELSDDTLNLVGEIERPRVTICPEQSAQPVIGGGSDCLQSQTVADGSYTIGVTQLDFDLDAAAEFRAIIGRGAPITTSDLLAYELEQARGADVGSPLANVNIQVISQRDRTANLVDADTGEIISPPGAVQIKEVQYTYRGYVAEANNQAIPDEIRTRLFAVYNNPDGNEDTDDVRAFIVWVGVPSEGETVQNSPPGEALQRPAVRQVFDSFEIVP